MMANGLEALSRMQSTQASLLASGASSDKQKLHEAAVEFEALFVKLMLDSMKATLDKENRLVDGGQTEDIFGDMLYTEYSRNMTKAGDFGIARAIEKQMGAKILDPKQLPYQ